MEFRNAKENELNKVLEIYDSVRGKGFCVWNELYPVMSDIINDYNHNNLYVMVDNNNVIGALSVLTENEMDHYTCFEYKGKEIARICVAPNYQGNGIAYKMVSEIIDIFRRQKVSAIHISAQVENIPALKTYKKLGFIIRGREAMYGNNYFLLEKVL